MASFGQGSVPGADAHDLGQVVHRARGRDGGTDKPQLFHGRASDRSLEQYVVQPVAYLPTYVTRTFGSMPPVRMARPQDTPAVQKLPWKRTAGKNAAFPAPELHPVQWAPPFPRALYHTRIAMAEAAFHGLQSHRCPVLAPMRHPCVPDYPYLAFINVPFKRRVHTAAADVHFHHAFSTFAGTWQTGIHT